jgi:hypothetical protein
MTARQIIEARLGRLLGPIATMPRDLRRALYLLALANDMHAMKSASSVAGHSVGNLTAQLFDVGVMMQAGQNQPRRRCCSWLVLRTWNAIQFLNLVFPRVVKDEVDYWKQMLEKAEECLASANSIKNVIAAERDCLAAENASLKARGAGARNAAMLDCVRIVAEERNKQEPGPLFKVLNEAMGKIEDARFAPTKTESPGELVEALRAISMAQSLSVAQQTALKLIKDLGGQND